MPRIHIHLQDIESIEELEDQDDWELQIGLRAADERQQALQASQEVRSRRRNARGSTEALRDRISERRKTVRRGGKRA